MLKKYKKEVVIFLSALLFYFILGSTISYYLETTDSWNVMFDLDTPRVFGDLSLRNYNHYRVAVHPLFVIFFQPIVLILNQIINNSNISIILIQSIFASASAILLYKLLGRITKNNNIINLITIVFIISFGQIVFASSIETYIFAQFFLLLLWFFVSIKLDKKLKYFDYVIIVLLGIANIAVTITNFVQYLIALFFLVFYNKNIEKRFITCILICACVLAFSVFLATLQNMYWESAPNFFIKLINDFCNDSSEEKGYMNKNITFNSILNVLNVCFAYSFNISNLTNETKEYITFSDNMISNCFSVMFFLVFLISNLFFIIKTKKELKEHKLYYGLLMALFFNLMLHVVYGNETAFLYICHYNFILFLLIAYLLDYFKLLKNKKIVYTFLILSIILSGSIIIQLISMLINSFNNIEKFSIIPILFIAIVSIALSTFILKNKYLRIIVPVIIVIISCVIYIYLNRFEIIFGNKIGTSNNINKNYYIHMEGSDINAKIS